MLSNDIPQSLAPGTMLQNGAFETQNALGRGGFGITYTARDVRLERDVAIKEFFPEGCARNGNAVAPGNLSDEDFRAALGNFEDEARVLARFGHPNIVDVYSVFEENDTAYMVMEWVRGASLQNLVEERGAFSPEEAVALIEPICDALETVHGASLLHGDITPSNIMRTENGRVVLLDFGLTRRIAQAGYATMRLSNTRLGTAGYAPLEQYGRQSTLVAASDVYSLAATLFFLLTGETPPEATDRATGIALPDLRASNPAMGENLARAINDGLAIEASARPQSAKAFCESLTDAQNPAQPMPASMPAPVQDVLRQDVLRKDADARTNAPRRAEETDDDDDDWQQLGGYREPQREPVDPLLDLLFGNAPGPQRVPQRVPRRFPQRRSPQPDNPFESAPSGQFIVPGCTGGCGVGCIILLFFGFMILSFFSSLLEPVIYILSG